MNGAGDPVNVQDLAAKDAPADHCRNEQTPRTIASQSGRESAVYRTDAETACKLQWVQWFRLARHFQGESNMLVVTLAVVLCGQAPEFVKGYTPQVGDRVVLAR